MTMLFVPVRYGNLLRRAKSVTASTSDASYPVTYLYDLQPERPWRASGTTGSVNLEADLEHADNTNPGFESWSGGAPVGWTKVTDGTGAVTEEGTIVHGGAKAVKFSRTDNTSNAYIYKDWAVPSGGFLRGNIWARDAGAVGKMVVQDLKSAYYAAPGGPPGGTTALWAAGSATAIGFLALGSGAYAKNTLFDSVVGTRLNLLDYGTTREDLTTVRLAIGLFDFGGGPGGGTTFYVDDLSIFHDPTFASLHWHNLPVGTEARVQSSPDNSIWTTRALLSLARDRSFITWSTIDARYWRLQLDRATLLQSSGSSAAFDSAPWLGELVFAQPITLLKDARNAQVRWIQPQNRSGVGGAAWSYRRTLKPHRELELSWFHNEEVASYEQMRDEVYRRSEGGEQPIVLTWGSDAEDVVHGHLAEQIEFPRAALPHYEHPLRIGENVPPLVP